MNDLLSNGDILDRHRSTKTAVERACVISRSRQRGTVESSMVLKLVRKKDESSSHRPMSSSAAGLF